MTKIPVIYLVEDDIDFSEATKELLDCEGLTTRVFNRGVDMLAELDPEWAGVILSDVKMPKMDGFELLHASQDIAPEVPFVMMTGHGDIPMALAAVEAGAYGFLEKPIRPEYLLSQIHRALSSRKLFLENQKLRRRVARFADMGVYLLGTSRVMKYCRKELLDVAPLPLPVLIYGEGGTGKELAARTIHDFSDVDGEFVVVNCSIVTEPNFSKLLDLQGSLTNTLFFRALHTLPLSLQNILSDFLRQNSDIRVITSITGEPSNHLADGTLSEELYYLINVATIQMPALRNRDKDIYLLLESFMREAAERFGKKMRMLSAEQLHKFYKYKWPGNVRELRNSAERIIIGLPVELQSQNSVKDGYQNTSYEQAMYEFEKSLLEQTLVETGGHRGEAANLLSIPRKRLYLRLKSVGLTET
ncbi:MAG: sigma-54-dependent transcriptional regulator [Rhodothermales bacterium]